MADVKPPLVLKPGEKQVWITCRVQGRVCDGKQAIMSPPLSQSGGSPKAGFVPVLGGKVTRYRCTTCNGTFVIGT